ncbi:MAG TPA: PLP-dependent aminotransferase family protein [Vicinamibacterales bacterium]|nr:PLP-dependent aminotransferase family protein [Vicinamibacterales bacterium]
MTTLHVDIDRSLDAPIHQQICDGLRRAILDGRIRPGRRIPSTRTLAADLGVSRFPVLAAYDQLLHEGYLVGRVGSGTYVRGELPDDLFRAPVRSDGGTANAAGRSHVASLCTRDEGGLGPFRMSLPALDEFPHRLWARLVARHAHALPRDDMAYGDPAGVASLRVAIAEHLRAARGVRCEAAEVLIVPGSQAALRLAGAVLLARGDRAALEEPGYPGARAALGASGAELVSVPVDEEGLSVPALRSHGDRVRLAYVTPSHQYPLGIQMTAVRRLALLEWASRGNAWVLEDDYDSEYRYVSRPLGALQGMDSHGRVIYIGTFSKVLFPAVRVAYLVVPPSLWQRFVDAREAFDLFSPTLYQLALADFVQSGQFARHLRRMRRVYQGRRDALVAGLARHCGDWLIVHNADAGLHVSALLASGLTDQDVVARIARRGLTATALSSCYAGRARRSGLLLGFGGSAERRLLDATRVLGEVLRTSALDAGQKQRTVSPESTRGRPRKAAVAIAKSG